MTHTQFNNLFVGVAFKRLSDVDAGRGTSRQHEVGITKAMRKGFLAQLKADTFQTTYVRLDDETDPVTIRSSATHYDVRRSKPKREEEWRLYYNTNPATELMRPGDALFLILTKKRELLFIVAGEASEAEQQLFRLFRIQPHDQSQTSREFSSQEAALNFADQHFLKCLDIVEVENPDEEYLGDLVMDFEDEFPSGQELSSIARKSLPQIEARENPDTALYAWLERETSLFKLLETKFLSRKLRPGFVKDGTADVNGFLWLAKSTLNRRNARMGRSLENHIQAVLDAFDLRYVRNALTEDRHRPDFLFPSAETYARGAQGDICLVMLGAKSTCRDRWRQVLTEAAKIPNKHLLTLETSISENQTTQMRNSNLSLVVPADLHSTFTEAQRQWLWSVRDFVEMVEDKQK